MLSLHSYKSLHLSVYSLPLACAHTLVVLTGVSSMTLFRITLELQIRGLHLGHAADGLAALPHGAHSQASASAF